jgi:ribosomal protein L11 methyltransferase
MQNYILCEVTCNSEFSEILSAELGQLGYEGFIDTEKGFEAFLPESDFSEEALFELLAEYGFGKDSVVVRIVENQNWNALWESDFEPVCVGNTLRIRAPFHPTDSDFAMELIIQPKTSFGTGHHETTHTIMELILQENMQDKLVFDYGSGTGILAILASKLGSRKIIANDIDPWAVENIFENMALNEVSNIEFVHGDIGAIQKEKFDFILANINKNILMGSFEPMKSLIKEEGTLIISGFYDTDLPDLLLEAQKAGFNFKNSVVKNKWTAAIFNC